jgi:zinc transporter 1/2/3
VIDHHKHNVDSYAAHGSEGDEHCGTDDANRYKTSEKASGRPKVDDIESVQETGGMDDSAATQIIGVCILEFGIVLHRYEDGHRSNILSIDTNY